MPYQGPARLQLIVQKLFRSRIFLLKPFQTLFKIVLHLEIPPIHFRNELVLVHPYSIQISKDAKIGSRVTIFNNVTIGIVADGMSHGSPIIEDDVTIYPYSIIIGNITIGKGSIIGAGSVVRTAIPANSVVAGNPAKAINEGDPRFCVRINHT